MVRKTLDSRIAEFDFDQPVQPTNSSVLEFVNSRPNVTSENDLFRHFKAKGTKRKHIRSILNFLEADGRIKRTTSKSFIGNFNLPRQSEVVIVEARNKNEIAGRAIGRSGVFGPRIPIIIPRQLLNSDNPFEVSVDDRVFCTIKKKRHSWEATVMRKTKHPASHKLVGKFSITGSAGDGFVQSATTLYRDSIFVPRSHTNGARHGDLVEITYEIVGRFRQEHVTALRVIGRGDNREFPYTLAVIENDLPTDFPIDVKEQIKDLSPGEVNRIDFTDKKLVTIDPIDAKDHDDAVFAEQLQDGWRVIVAIADVSAYIPHNSPIDLEARKRGNSTYLPGRVIPMLPFELSAEVCSLKPNQTRFCLLADMTFSTTGEKKSHTFHRAIMKSAGHLTYEDTQNAIDGKPCSDLAKSLLKPVLKPLWGAYRALRVARNKREPIAISSSESHFKFDEKGEITDVSTKKILEAHRLIEEFMVQANVAAAETLTNCGFSVIYRTHDKPKPYKVGLFSECLEGLGIEPSPTTRIKKPSFFNRLVNNSDYKEYSVGISEAILRCQSQARYSTSNIGHFGLNLEHYVHFTSPIRRYSDLIVHRALIKTLSLGNDGTEQIDKTKLDQLAEHLSVCERRSTSAERRILERLFSSYYESKCGSKYIGHITGMTENGIFVRLSDTSATGYIPVLSLQGHNWRFRPHRLSLENEQKSKTYQFGQEVEVELIKSETLTGKLELKMLSSPIELKVSAHEMNLRKKIAKGKKLSRKQQKFMRSVEHKRR